MEHVIRPIEEAELARIIHSGEDVTETEYLAYNYFGDYALLAFLLKGNGIKKISGGEVAELRNDMKRKLSMMEDLDTTYRNYEPFYIKHKDMLEYSGGNKYVPDDFILKDNISTLDVAKRVVTIFDRRQLSTVLSIDALNVLLSLLPEEEKTKENVKK